MKLQFGEQFSNKVKEFDKGLELLENKHSDFLNETGLKIGNFYTYKIENRRFILKIMNEDVISNKLKLDIEKLFERVFK